MKLNGSKQRTLLDIAKSTRTVKTGFSKDEKELVIAWLNSEITLTQLTTAKKLNSTSAAYSYISMVAREMWRSK